jgi:hypothetical protein
LHRSRVCALRAALREGRGMSRDGRSALQGICPVAADHSELALGL